MRRIATILIVAVLAQGTAHAQDQGTAPVRLTVLLLASPSGRETTLVTDCGAPPRPIVMPQPVVPDSLRTSGDEYRVQVRVVIDESGDVVEAEVARSDAPPELERAVIEAALASTFTPSIVRGTPIACRIVLPYRIPGKPRITLDAELASNRVAAGDTVSVHASFAAEAETSVTAYVSYPGGSATDDAADGDAPAEVLAALVPSHHGPPTRLEQVVRPGEPFELSIRFVAAGCGADSVVVFRLASYSDSRPGQLCADVVRVLRFCVDDGDHGATGCCSAVE
jgi:TonB family protein